MPSKFGRFVYYEDPGIVIDSNLRRIINAASLSLSKEGLTPLEQRAFSVIVANTKHPQFVEITDEKYFFPEIEIHDRMVRCPRCRESYHISVQACKRHARSCQGPFNDSRVLANCTVQFIWATNGKPSVRRFFRVEKSHQVGDPIELDLVEHPLTHGPAQAQPDHETDRANISDDAGGVDDLNGTNRDNGSNMAGNQAQDGARSGTESETISPDPIENWRKIQEPGGIPRRFIDNAMFSAFIQDHLYDFERDGLNPYNSFGEPRQDLVSLQYAVFETANRFSIRVKELWEGNAKNGLDELAILAEAHNFVVPHDQRLLAFDTFGWWIFTLCRLFYYDDWLDWPRMADLPLRRLIAWVTAENKSTDPLSVPEDIMLEILSLTESLMYHLPTYRGTDVRYLQHPALCAIVTMVYDFQNRCFKPHEVFEEVFQHLIYCLRFFSVASCVHHNRDLDVSRFPVTNSILNDTKANSFTKLLWMAEYMRKCKAAMMV